MPETSRANGNGVYTYDYAQRQGGYNPYNVPRNDPDNSEILVVDSQPPESAQPSHYISDDSQPYSQESYQEPAGESFVATQLVPSQASQYKATQPIPTPEAAQQEDPTWGELVPNTENRNCPKINLTFPPYEYHVIGRLAKWVQDGHRVRTDTVISNPKISGVHCKIWREYDVTEPGGEYDATVMIEDCSSNGTFVRGVKVGKGNKTYLDGGDEISLGTPEGNILDVADQFRFIFHPKVKRRANIPRDPNAAGGFYRKYDLSHQIGKGSFASVWRALEKATGKWRAVKIINKTKFAGNEKTAIMLKREVEIMQGLDHPYIVKYIEGFEDQGMLYLVMELVTGGDLLDFISNKGGLNEEETSEIAFMVCDALSYLHKKGIAHRDLKPENLLLTRGEHPQCKVADFGLAKLSDEKTFFKTMCGTPAYLAPEVVLQQPQQPGYDFAVDAWSIGVVIYSCLANASPFNEDDQIPLTERMKVRRPDMEFLHSIGCSELAIDFINRLLQTNPLDRMSVQDALLHPWINNWQIRRRYSSGQVSFLTAAHSPPAPSNSAPTYHAKHNSVDSSVSQSSHANSHFRPGDSAATSRFGDSVLSNGGKNRLEEEDEEHGDAVSEAASYSQRLGNLRLESEFPSPDVTLADDHVPHMNVDNKQDGAVSSTPPPKYNGSEALLSQSLKRKAPSSAFSSDSSMQSAQDRENASVDASISHIQPEPACNTLVPVPPDDLAEASAMPSQSTIPTALLIDLPPEDESTSDTSSLSSLEPSEDDKEEPLPTKTPTRSGKPTQPKSNGSSPVRKTLSPKSTNGIGSRPTGTRRSTRLSSVQPSYEESEDEDDEDAKKSIRNRAPVRIKKQRKQ